MKTSLDCIPCFIKQSLSAARLMSDDDTIHESVIRKVLHWCSELDLTQSPPVLAQKIHRYLRQVTDNEDPYKQIKAEQNQLAMTLIEGLNFRADTGEDHLKKAVTLAIAGNIIDLGAKSSVKPSDIQNAINQALSSNFGSQLENFRHEIDNAEKILFLADNAGEIVFDKLLIEVLGTQKVTLAVRGGPVINDVTRADAEMVGLTDIVTVIDNGSDAPGTILTDCSKDFIKEFKDADLIIAKGQGNFESLSAEDANIFFLLKAKCRVIADALQVPVGSHVLTQQRCK